MEKTHILTAKEIDQALRKLINWSVQNGKLHSDFKFPNFKQAIGFIDQVADIAEEMGHHPEIYNIYNRVSFSLCTHDAGDKITDKDVTLAAMISKIDW